LFFITHSQVKKTTVPPLFDLCASLLQKHLDDLPVLADVDDPILYRILGVCEWQKLDEIERKNAEGGVELNTERLWEILARRDYGKYEFRSLVHVIILANCSDKLNLDNERPWKSLYLHMNSKRMEMERKARDIKDQQQKLKQQEKRTLLASGPVGNTTKTTKLTKKLEEPIRISNSRSSSSSSRTRTTTSRSNSSSNSSSTSAASKKSKLWTKSLSETTAPRVGKMDLAPQKDKVMSIPSKGVTTNSYQAPPGSRYNSHRNVTAPSLSMHSSTFNEHINIPQPEALRIRQPVVQRQRQVDFTKRAPGSPPPDAVSGSPLISPSYMEDIFGKETSKRFDKVKRQSQNNSNKMRDSARVSAQQRPNPSQKHSLPPPSRSSSSAPPQKKTRTMAPPSSSLDLDFHIPKKRQ